MGIGLKKIEKVIATFTIFYPKNNFHIFQTQCFIEMYQNYNVPELIPILGEEEYSTPTKLLEILKMIDKEKQQELLQQKVNNSDHQ